MPPMPATPRPREVARPAAQAADAGETAQGTSADSEDGGCTLSIEVLTALGMGVTRSATG